MGEAAIEKNGTQVGLLEPPVAADNSHFHKSKHFQGDLAFQKEGLLEAPADNSHFDKSKHFQEGLPSQKYGLLEADNSHFDKSKDFQECLPSPSTFVSSSSTSARKEMMELFDRIQREVEVQKYNREEEEEWELQRRMELAQ